MPVKFGPHTTRDYQWTALKAEHAKKNGSIQHTDDGDFYTIWFYDKHELHTCTIWKNLLVPDSVLASGYSQVQNDTDRSDFETNFLPSSNRPVDSVTGVVSQFNSTTVPLAANATFFGVGEDVDHVVSTDISVLTDQISAAGGLVIQWSDDNIKYDYTEAVTVFPNAGQPLSFFPRSKYFKLSYTNGLATQTYFSLSVKHYPIQRSTYVQNLSSDIPSNKETDVVRAVLAGQRSTSQGGSYTNLQLSDSGMLKVAIETAVFPSANAASIVQRGNINGTGTSFTKTLNNNTKMGNTLIVVLVKDQPIVNANYVLSDSQSNAYIKAAQTKVSSTRQIDIWYSSSAGGPLTVQAAGFGVSGTAAMQIYEVSGLLAYGNVIDKIATAQNTGTSLPVGPTTTLQNGEFCITVYATVDLGAISPGSGWTSDLGVTSLGAVFSQIQNTAGSLTSSATSNLSITAIGVMMTFLPAGTPKPILTGPDGKLLIDGSYVTQPVSAVSLPLPAGASTEATLAAIKTDVDKIPTNPSQEHATSASPNSTRLSDGTAFYDATKTGQLPSSLVGGRLDENIGSWLGSTVPTVGQKTMASSIPVVLSSDQPAIPISGTVQVTVSPTGASTGLQQGQVNGGGSGQNTKIPIRSTAYTEQSSNAQRSVKSSSANDTAAGTGARTIELTYYTSTFTGPFTETITMNGTAAVNTVSTTICYVEKIKVVTSGSNNTNVGTISLFTTTGGGGSAFASIGVGNIVTSPSTGDGKTYYAHHYVPTGKTATFSTIICGTNGNQNGIMYLMSKDLSVANATETTISDFLTVGLSTSSVTRQLGIPIKVTGPAIVTLIVVPKGNNTDWFGSFDFSEV